VAHEVGFGAGAGEFVAGGAEDGAHGEGGVGGAAEAVAVALFDFAGEFVVAEDEVGGSFVEAVVMVKAEVFCEDVGVVIDDFAGVEQVVGIEDVFELAEEFCDFGAVLFGDEGGADEALAVFAADGSAEGPDEIEDFVGELLEFSAVFWKVEVEEGSGV